MVDACACVFQTSEQRLGESSLQLSGNQEAEYNIRVHQVFNIRKRRYQKLIKQSYLS